MTAFFNNSWEVYLYGLRQIVTPLRVKLTVENRTYFIFDLTVMNVSDKSNLLLQNIVICNYF